MSTERDKAWRRDKDQVKSQKGQGSKEIWHPEKQWDQLYLRSEKLKRAQQLGFDYPRKSERELLAAY
ncbi:MAG: hypothetical protein GY775_20455 [Candidatus Scalindua sp.]|nr:hypothetical protein [Candidatus Scalindua sp.]